MSSAGQVLTFNPTLHSSLIPYLAAIHASCITHDRTIAFFLPPLSHEKLLIWWKERIAEVSAGTRRIYIHVNGIRPGEQPSGPDVAGVVMLWMPASETSQPRAFVEQLMVQKTSRGKGVARALLGVLEEDSRRLKKAVLSLELECNTPAELVFGALGYHEVGKVPKYALSPRGELKDGVSFYKQLQP